VLTITAFALGALFMYFFQRFYHFFGLGLIMVTV